ncbi:MAG: tRNA (guanosine(46)-N7)-methyltransferase TrmB [Bacteroidetes bacterium]|nr:tRNA (guanosine(46)-N7)-methyltransferase TrmB [Bacteroidota bacterium]
MGKNKLEKFAELKEMSNVFEKDGQMKGKWNSHYFKNQGKITLELACGKGDYALGLAQLFPEDNFIGMDIKGNRIWTAATRAGDHNLENVCFIRDQIDHLADYFEPGEVDEIWITFADPFLQPGRARRRLTSPKFLEIYKPILKKGGVINLKTDSDLLYQFTLETIQELGLKIIHNYPDIYQSKVTHLTYDIQTYYEQKHLKNGLTIKYVSFTY